MNPVNSSFRRLFLLKGDFAGERRIAARDALVEGPNAIHIGTGFSRHCLWRTNASQLFRVIQKAKDHGDVRLPGKVVETRSPVMRKAASA